MTAPPAMIATGTAAQILGNLTGGSTLTETALYKVAVTFVSNVPPDEFVLWENRLEGVPPVVAYFAPDGTLKRNGDPVKLLANDSGLNVTGLQWTCKIDGKVQFTFDAGVADEVVDLSTVVHTPSTSVVALTTVPLAGIQGSTPTGRAMLSAANVAAEWGILGQIPDANLPPLALITFKGHKANQAAMLATTGESGDWVIRDDSATVWVVTGTPTSSLGSWTQWPYPAPLWAAIPDKPAYVGAGATAAAARAVIDAVGGGASVTGATDGQAATVASGSLVAHSPLYIDPTQAPYNVKPDCRTFVTASMSSSSSPTNLTVTGYAFTAADIGKQVKVVGAAAAGADLKTTITGFSAGKAVLASPCLTTVSGAFCIFGTDNAAALETLFADISHTGSSLGRAALFGQGVILYSGTIKWPYGGAVLGATKNWENLFTFWGRVGGAEDTQGTVFYQMWDQNVDCARFRNYGPTLPAWVGFLEGFVVMQDLANTAGNGISSRNAAGTPIAVIDGGTIRRIACVAAQAGWEFPVGITGNAVFRDLAAWGCGYMDRQLFTADTTSGSTTLSNVSSFTGLAVGHNILSGPGIAVDSVIMSLNSGAGTLVMSLPATATATGVAVQRAGSAGVEYTVQSSETVHFDGLSCDQCSGGAFRLTGTGTGGPPASVVFTSVKNEFGINAYRESYNFAGSPPSVPQGSNLLVLKNAQTVGISVNGYSHWANASSSVGGSTPNTMGRPIGAVFLDLPISAVAADVEWTAGNVRLATGSGQTESVVFRDLHSSVQLPISNASKGSNRVRPRGIRALIADANVTLTGHDALVGWSSITAARTATLPYISLIPNLIPAGRELLLFDASGSASATNTITAVAASGDTIVGDIAVTTPYGRLAIVFDGTRWVGTATAGVASATHAATSKAAPVDADELPLVDSAASNALKRLTWANLKATLRTYFDSLTTTFTNKTMSGALNTFSSISADSTIDGTANKVYTATEQTKLAAFNTLIDTERVVELTNGESTMSRRSVINATVASGNGNMRFTYFIARKTETITQIRIPTGGTAAVGATLCRLGIYQVDGSGNIALVASTANDTTLWIAASTSYVRALSASWSKVRGTLYAIAPLVVGSSAAPTFCGQNTLLAAEAAAAPRMGSLLAGQTDLPASATAGSLGDQGHLTYVALLP